MSPVLQNCRFFWFSFLVHRFRLISIVSCFAFNSVQAGLQIYGLFIYGFNDYFYLRTHLLCFCAFVWGVQSLGRILGHFRFLWLYFALLSEKNDRNRTSDLSNHFVCLFVFQMEMMLLVSNHSTLIGLTLFCTWRNIQVLLGPGSNPLTSFL